MIGLTVRVPGNAPLTIQSRDGNETRDELKAAPRQFGLFRGVLIRCQNGPNWVDSFFGSSGSQASQ
jgi:hypothetical protein